MKSSSELSKHASLYAFFAVLFFGASMVTYMILPLVVPKVNETGIVFLAGTLLLSGTALLVAGAVRKICELIQQSASVISEPHRYGGGEGRG